MSSPQRWVVREQTYTPPNTAGVRRLLPEQFRRLAAFTTAEAAHADCTKRLTEFRRSTNPFQLGGPGLYYQTSFPPFVLHDYLLDHGIDPPSNSLSANPSYVFWWLKKNREFTDREREIVWVACDKLQPLNVIAEDDRLAVHVVLERATTDWSALAGMEYRFVQEGGLLQEAYASIRSARALARELDDELREHYGEAEFVIQDDSKQVRWLEPQECRFVEIVAVPGPGIPPPMTQVSLIARQSYWSRTGGYEMASADTMYNLGVRVPLCWANSSIQSHEFLNQRLQAAKRTVNPFALVWPDGFNWYTLSDEDDAADRLLPSGISIDDAIEIVRQLPLVPPMPEVPTAEWYDRLMQWSPEFIEVIWSTFADFRLFEVVEVPFSGKPT